MTLSRRSTPEAAIEAFLVGPAAAAGLGQGTRRAYAADLGQFARFLHTRIAGPTVAAVTATDVEAFAAHLLDLGRRPRTVARKLAAVRALCRWLRRTGVCAEDPARQVAPPAACHDPEPPTLAQVQALLRLPATDTFLGARDRALLELLYGAGLRLGDLLRLNLSHLDLDPDRGRGWLRVAGRRLPLGAPATEALRGYLRRRAEVLVERSIAEVDVGALFVSARGRRLRPRALQRRVDACLRRLEAGPAEGGRYSPARGPEVLRAACERHLIDAGADPGLVAALLGRRRLRTPLPTVDVDELATRYRRAHPRA